jgi:hypothetical protein
MYNCPINIISSLQDTHDAKHLIIEITPSSSLEELAGYGFSPLQITKIRENITKDPDNQKKTLVFSHLSEQYEKITCFFP